MSNPYVQSTPDHLQEMLERVGAASIDEIFEQQIPAEYQYKKRFNLPPALSELEVQSDFAGLASQNVSTQQFTSFLGGGIYDHFIPAAVGHLAGRSEFVTSYTPYQPEASQGTLQAFFEFQSMVARLYGMDASNASLYDGASALGEAVFLALGARPDRAKVLLSHAVHPDFRATVETYLQHFDVQVETVPQENGQTNLEALAAMAGKDTAAVVLQHPNYFGCLEETHEVSRIVHDAGALLITVNDPISLGLLQPPGAYGADIAVGEGQSLGLRPFLGGESLGLFTAKSEFLRKMPGRLVGLTKDREQRRGFVLTLQTREQHIRREKATSNICTNHAHNALRATVYLSLMGETGMRWVARRCVRNLQRLRSRIHEKKPAAVAYTSPTFKEVVLRLNRPATEVRDALTAKQFYAGVPLAHLGKEYENLLLVCTTEKHTDAMIDKFCKEVEPYL